MKLRLVLVEQTLVEVEGLQISEGQAQMLVPTKYKMVNMDRYFCCGQLLMASIGKSYAVRSHSTQRIHGFRKVCFTKQ